MAKAKHTHQYHKIYPYGKPGNKYIKDTGVWACALPDCTHFMPHNVAAQVIGKLSLCNNCMDSFILDEVNMENDKPICHKCSNPDAITIPADFNWERHETRSYIANKLGIPHEEVTEEQIDKQLILKAFDRNK